MDWTSCFDSKETRRSSKFRGVYSLYVRWRRSDASKRPSRKHMCHAENVCTRWSSLGFRGQFKDAHHELSPQSRDINKQIGFSLGQESTVVNLTLISFKPRFLLTCFISRLLSSLPTEYKSFHLLKPDGGTVTLQVSSVSSKKRLSEWG